jgi:hypothetical protein
MLLREHRISLEPAMALGNNDSKEAKIAGGIRIEALLGPLDSTTLVDSPVRTSNHLNDDRHISAGMGRQNSRFGFSGKGHPRR